MPKVTWNTPKKTHAPVDPVIELISRQQKFMRVTSKKLGEITNMDPSVIRRRKLKGAQFLRLGDLKEWSHALGIPPEDVAEAVVQYLKK